MVVVKELDDPVIPSGVMFSHFAHAPPLPNSREGETQELLQKMNEQAQTGNG